MAGEASGGSSGGGSGTTVAPAGAGGVPQPNGVGGSPGTGGGTPPIHSGAQPAQAPTPDPAAAGAAPPGTPVTPEVKKHKVRVGKKEIEVTEADLLQSLRQEIGEDGVLDVYKLRRGAYERFEEAKRIDARLEQAVKTFKDPAGVRKMLTDLHGPVEAERMIDQWITEREQVKKMTPEQRREFEDRRRFQAEKAQVAAERQRQEAAKAAQRNQEVAKQVQAQFTEVLTAMNLPANTTMIARMATIARDAARRGVPMTYQDVAKQVSSDLRTEVSAIIKALKPEQRREFLGDEVIAEIRSMEADRLKAGGPHIVQPRAEDGRFVPVKGNPAPGAPPVQPKRRPIAEVFAERRARLLNGG